MKSEKLKKWICKWFRHRLHLCGQHYFEGKYILSWSICERCGEYIDHQFDFR